MKSTTTRPCGLVGILLAVAACTVITPGAQADVGPPVEIKMAPDTHQAVVGEEYAGTFEVRIFRPGQLLGFEISGEGWTVLSAEFPDEPHDAPIGTLSIPFRAIPADADKAIALSFQYNGRWVRQQYEIGPAYFATAGKPGALVQIPDTLGRPRRLEPCRAPF